MPDVFLSDKKVAKRYDVHRSTLWRWIKSDARFPAPVLLSPGCTRWKLSDLEAWEAERSE